MSRLRTEIQRSIANVPREAWNGLLSPSSTPFVDHRFLSALERSGCAGPRAGWAPAHLTLWRDDTLVAAAPAYVKADSDGDFARDWDLGSAATQARLHYYPKLVVGVPFTPCTGERLLLASDLSAADAAEVRRALITSAEAFCRAEQLGTLQVLFSTRAEADVLEVAGLARRVSYQFHWHNEGYRDYQDFLSRFTSKRRAMLKRERAQTEKQGIAIRTLREADLRRDPDGTAHLAHALHSSTVQKLGWGRGWLNAAFYEELFRTMPEHLELVLAERNGKPIAGAFNVAGAAGAEAHLFGRYWGSFEDHPFLHFNVCYYHSIEECIARGVSVFEGGAGGEHKLSRGFLPRETYSSHLFFDPQVDASLRAHLRSETPAREAQLAHWRTEASGYRTVLAHPPITLSAPDPQLPNLVAAGETLSASRPLTPAGARPGVRPQINPPSAFTSLSTVNPQASAQKSKERPSQGEVVVVTLPKQRERLQRPSLYRVLLHNDDFTPMEFVLALLETVFQRSESEAMAIMLRAHTTGIAVAGVYGFEIAEAKVEKVSLLAREANFPLLCTLEPDGDSEGDPT